MEPFEPKAQSILNDIGKGNTPKGVTCYDAYAVSIAISLKRIADALETITNAACGDFSINVSAKVHY